MRDGEMLFVGLNVILQVFLGMAAVWAGYALARLA